MTLLAGNASLAQERPNNALIISDDQGWYGLSVQMHPDLPNSRSDFFHTPRLEELASQGMRFSDAYAPSGFPGRARRGADPNVIVPLNTTFDPERLYFPE